jgi:hypothetical protein
MTKADEWMTAAARQTVSVGIASQAAFVADARILSRIHHCPERQYFQCSRDP